MSLIDRTAPRLLAVIALALLGAACGSDDGTSVGPTVAVASASSDAVDRASATPAGSSDQALADAALLSPKDLAKLDGHFKALDPGSDWPFSAEIAARAPECVPFAEDVFGGGPDHAPSATVTLRRGVGADADDLFAYTVVFATPEEAAHMIDTFASPAFDDCWPAYMSVAALASAYGITEAHYQKATPAKMRFDADSYFARMVTGPVVIDGATFDDSCVCVFAQVGRAVVGVHSAFESFDTEERITATQAAINKMRELLG